MVKPAIFGSRTSISEEDLFHELCGVAELLGANLAVLSTENALAIFQKIVSARNAHVIAGNAAGEGPSLGQMEVAGHG